jgi:hypothetical protein
LLEATDWTVSILQVEADVLGANDFENVSDVSIFFGELQHSDAEAEVFDVDRVLVNHFFI